MTVSVSDLFYSLVSTLAAVMECWYTLPNGGSRTKDLLGQYIDS
jgi:hypothetical protein